MSLTIDERARKLSDSLDGVERNLRKIITDAAMTKNSTNLYWANATKLTRAEFEKMRKITYVWSFANIPDVYNENLRNQVQRIKALKLIPPKNPTYFDIKRSVINTRSISTLLNDFNNTWALQIDQSQKFMLRTFNMTQNILIEESRINALIDEGIFRTGSTYGVQKNLQKEFMGKLLNGQYITVINKNGKAIHYNIDSYSEMVANTKLREAQTISTVNTAVDFGTDLVQVSSHNTLTPYDAQFEGKIFSLSGNDPDFPKATVLPPFHPNCKHTISIVFREMLEQRGIQKYIDYSNGTSQVHPTRTKQKPLSDRFPKGVVADIEANKISV